MSKVGVLAALWEVIGTTLILSEVKPDEEFARSNHYSIGGSGCQAAHAHPRTIVRTFLFARFDLDFGCLLAKS